MADSYFNSPKQRTTSPTAGQIAFDGTHFQGWNGAAWKQLDN